MLAMVLFQRYQAILPKCRWVLNAMSILIEMPFVVFRGKQIRLVVNITTCARNATMNTFVKPIAPTIQVNATGAVNTPNA
ncbi:hypothetical protein CJX26_21745 [Salmonella enterica]|nr:hypothetical protein [Salmonella enterica]EBN1473792.1 hypothetical protein [Salmonella enterica]EBN3576045.1 hypothetical protein [Salmonella enterica]